MLSHVVMDESKEQESLLYIPHNTFQSRST
jgi:hypothetical protein